jgi:hypothetical protein
LGLHADGAAGGDAEVTSDSATPNEGVEGPIIFDRRGPGRYVSIAEAARLLDVKPDVVRRRVRAGTVEAREVRRPQGKAWEVWMPDEVERSAAAAAVDPRVERAGALEIRSTGAGALADLVGLAGRLADESAGRARAEAALEAAERDRERLERLLEAADLRAVRAERRAELAERTLAELEAMRRDFAKWRERLPWWRRW